MEAGEYRTTAMVVDFDAVDGRVELCNVVPVKLGSETDAGEWAVGDGTFFLSVIDVIRRWNIARRNVVWRLPDRGILSDDSCTRLPKVRSSRPAFRSETEVVCSDRGAGLVQAVAAGRSACEHNIRLVEPICSKTLND